MVILVLVVFFKDNRLQTRTCPRRCISFNAINLLSVNNIVHDEKKDQCKNAHSLWMQLQCAWHMSFMQMIPIRVDFFFYIFFSSPRNAHRSVRRAAARKLLDESRLQLPSLLVAIISVFCLGARWGLMYRPRTGKPTVHDTSVKRAEMMAV